MAIAALVAGRYSGAYNSVDVGITEQGYELQQESFAEIVNRSDAYADSAIELIYRGGNVHLQFESKVYAAGATTPFWPWGTLGVMATAAAPMARLGSDVASSMVLTDVDATPAATKPATLTISKAILAPNYPARLLFDSRVRNIPIRLMAIPTESTGTVTWFATT